MSQRRRKKCQAQTVGWLAFGFCDKENCCKMLYDCFTECNCVNGKEVMITSLIGAIFQATVV